MVDLQMIQQSTNWLTLIVGPFIGVSGAFILARMEFFCFGFKS